MVKILPASLSGLTSEKPAIVREMIVMYEASRKLYFSITINPIIPMITMARRRINGCSNL
jgi:hypothetical protein